MQQQAHIFLSLPFADIPVEALLFLRVLYQIQLQLGFGLQAQTVSPYSSQVT